MVGAKARVFELLHDVSLEDLVPHDSFYPAVGLQVATRYDEMRCTLLAVSHAAVQGDKVAR